MDIKEIQKLSADIVDKIDRKLNIKRDPQLNTSQLLEELGELTRLINSERLKKDKPNKNSLEDEFADVCIQLAKLADLFEIDLEKAILDKIEILKKRHNLQ